MQSLDIFHLELPARYLYLLVIDATVEAILTRVEGITNQSDTIYGLKLAVHEICNNVIEHAYGHENGRLSLTITLQQQPRQFILDLYDRGQSFEPTTVADPALDQPQVRGYGLYLARQLSDELEYEQLDEQHPWRNHWRLVKALT